MDSHTQEDEEDKCRGAILGAFVGDSCGSYAEFSTEMLTEKEMDQVIKMPGGGPFRLGPGQITDDSELALCMMTGILEGKMGELDDKFIAEEYSKWVKSNPFDIGITTRQALGPLKYKVDPAVSKQMAQAQNTKSQSNGAIMRATPLAVFLSRVEDYKGVLAAVKADVEFTHYNPVVTLSVFLYCSLIARLIKGEDPNQAIQAVRAMLDHQEINDLENESVSFARINVDTPFQWIDDAVQAADSYKGTIPEPSYISKCINVRGTSLGWLKWGFWLSFYFLRRSTSLDRSEIYKHAIRLVVQQGGDTDTNAAIVGGVIGAFVGFSNIPEKMSSKVLSFDCLNTKASGGRQRGDFLSTKKHLKDRIDKLLEHRPADSSELKVVVCGKRVY